MKPQELLADDDAFGTSLLTLAVDHYGTEALSWHPDALRQQLRADFGVDVPQQNLDKLLAAASLLTADDFYADEQRFVAVANALCGNGVDPNTFDPATVAECAWAVTEAALLDPDEVGSYGPGVRAYIGRALAEEGFLRPPSVLTGLADAPDTAPVDFTDDLELYNAIYDTQQARAAEVNRAVADGLGSLFAQLESLRLENGSAAGLSRRAGRLLAAAREAATAPSRPF